MVVSSSCLCEPGKPEEGDMRMDWSMVRSLLMQGAAIQQDYQAGKYASYEEYSARMDEAARERIGEFEAAKKTAPRGEPVAWMRDKDDENDSYTTMTACVSDRVKKLWLNCNPKQVERYTIPLYSSPPAQRDVVRDARAEALYEAAHRVELIGHDWKESGQQLKWYAAEYLRDDLLSMADEALKKWPDAALNHQSPLKNEASK